MKKLLISACRDLSEQTGFFAQHLLSKYPYMHRPVELLELLTAYRSVKNVAGCYVEIGCAYGATTVLMKKLDEDMEIGRPFHVIDTFSGFVSADADHDISKFGANASLRTSFSVNSPAWLAQTLRYHQLSGIEIIEGDAVHVDYAKFSPIAFCLIDVDLYKPIANLLPRIYDLLAPGGLILVDDCVPHPKWEGALIAYKEYMAARGLEPEISAKYGIVRKAVS